MADELIWRAEITAADALSLAEKLQEFGADLPPAEQALLAELCRRATATGADVQGFGDWWDSLATYYAPDRIVPPDGQQSWTA